MLHSRLDKLKVLFTSCGCGLVIIGCTECWIDYCNVQQDVMQ